MELSSTAAGWEQRSAPLAYHATAAQAVRRWHACRPCSSEPKAQQSGSVVPLHTGRSRYLTPVPATAAKPAGALLAAAADRAGTPEGFAERRGVGGSWARPHRATRAQVAGSWQHGTRAVARAHLQCGPAGRATPPLAPACTRWHKAGTVAAAPCSPPAQWAAPAARTLRVRKGHASDKPRLAPTKAAACSRSRAPAPTWGSQWSSQAQRASSQHASAHSSRLVAVRLDSGWPAAGARATPGATITYPSSRVNMYRISRGDSGAGTAGGPRRTSPSPCGG